MLQMLCLSVIGMMFSNPASAADIVGTASKIYPNRERIPDLEWRTDEVPIARGTTPDGTLFYQAVLAATVQDDGGTITIGKDTFHTSTEQGATTAIATLVPLQGERTEVKVTKVDVFGHIFREEFTVYFPDWTEQAVEDPLGKRFLLTPSVGISAISYSQTGFQNFSEDSVVFGLSALYILSARWDTEVNASMNGFSFDSNYPGVTARFLRVNGGAGYNFPFVSDPWKLSLMGGVFYSNMYVTQSAFGYHNLIGPQLYPELKRSFEDGDAMSLYFKYSPLSSGGTSLGTLGNREIVGGVKYFLRIADRYPVTFALDYSNLYFQGTTVSVSTNAFTLSLGYLF